MRKRKFCLAAILAAVMVMQAPMVAFATDESESGTTREPEVITYGDVSLSDGSEPLIVGAYEGGTTTAGNVTSTVTQEVPNDDGESYFPPAVEAMSNGTTNVTSVQTENTTAVLVLDGGTVNVVEDVSAKGDESAIYAENGTVKVGGDVVSSKSPAIVAEAGADVSVGGDVVSKSEAAIQTNSAANVSVDGNVTGTEGVIIMLGDDGKGRVELLGTTTATRDEGSAIVIETTLSDKEQILEKLPTIVVGNLETKSGEGELWIGGENNYDVSWDVYEAVYQQMLYYIAQDKFDNATLSVKGAKAYKNGYVSNEGKSLTVTITTADGYEVSSVSGASVVRNADGTYTVVVQRGKGIDINAVISAIVRAQEETSGGDNSESGINDNSGINDSNDSGTPVIVVQDYAVAQKEFQEVIAAQFKVLPAGGTLTLDMKNYISFNKKTFEVLSQRKDINIQIIYTWKGKRYLVVIPAGYDILSLLDANGYCGCLYLNSIFGSTELSK